MPLSPFSARLAFVSFLAIGSCVAANLLVLQTPDRELRASAGNVVPTSFSDAERLTRMALEAIGGPSDGSEAATPRRNGRRGGERTGADARIERIGSFAPSAGKLSLAALPGADPAEARRATIRAIQLELGRRGYDPGVANGAPGLVTRAAVMAYEHDQGLPITADPSPEVLAHLRHGTSAPGAAIGLDANAPAARDGAEQVIRTVQQYLGRLGYLAAAPDGTASDDTVRAIREFEMDSGLIPTGRISGPLVARLGKQQGTVKTQ